MIKIVVKPIHLDSEVDPSDTDVRFGLLELD